MSLLCRGNEIPVIARRLKDVAGYRIGKPLSKPHQRAFARTRLAA